MTIDRALVLAILTSAIVAVGAGSALAQACTREGANVSCDDGRRGLLSAMVAGSTAPVLAQACTRQGTDVTCDDDRRGIFSGQAIIWADGTRSSLASPHPSVIIGNKPSVRVGQGVFVGQGNRVVPLDDPNAPNKTRCAILDGVSYCY